MISIHSLVKRETADRFDCHGRAAISIHSLVKRETQQINRFSEWFGISIHSLVKRETDALETEFNDKAEFQSTPS